MHISTLLIANRGEIAIRIARAAAELSIHTVAIFSEDDAQSLHVRKADEAHPLHKSGAAAYLDSEQLIAIARATRCDAIHPGYGFLSENAAFARQCAEEGLIFVGPQAATLELFGDKGKARSFAMAQDIPVIPGTEGPTSLEEAEEFLRALGSGGAIMLKALAGGGGRGMRAVYRPEDLADSYTRCQSEARAAFGEDGVYVERLIRRARITTPARVQPVGTIAVTAPARGTVVSLTVQPGDVVQRGQQVAVLEAMKMEFLVEAPTNGVIHEVLAAVGETLASEQPLLFLEPADGPVERAEKTTVVDMDAIPSSLLESQASHAAGLDEARPQAVERRRRSGQRTIRENLADLCDPESFIEYGALALAAQRRRRSLEELVKISPADGLVAGIGSVNGALFPAERTRCMVLGYDYTVFAGTQGFMNHKKTDRLLHLAQQWKLPLVLFAEGGGGRPGDTDHSGVAGLDVMTFLNFAKLSGFVPLVGIVSGRCFAGNAALLGCCDIIIATQNATIGMGGPAMIEGGGLGVFTPEEVGPVEIQAPNGVIDIVVADEAEAVRIAKLYLSYFQGSVEPWTCADQRLLRQLIPENRLRVYDVRKVIETLADHHSMLELRRQFGVGIITALIRIEGRSFGVMANNSMHLGGAIDADAADKAARFMQLCDAFGLPILSLCDTPGFMVGPEAEKTATVRHVSRMFVTAGSLSIPFFSIVLRKGYGLGAQAMTGGSFHAPFFTVAWPSGEFGGMGLEGAVRLGYRKELEAISDPHERQATFETMVNAAYQQGKALNMASYLEIDDVIDPLETRRWVTRGLLSVPDAVPKEGKRRPFVDTW